MRFILFCILFLSSQVIVAQWTAISSGTTKDLSSVFFVDEQTGWIAGKDGVLKHTNNGGTSWTSQFATSEDINTLFFINPSQGWIAGKDGFIKTTQNGGATWISQFSGTESELNAIYFFDAQHGIAVGEKGTILTTTNGGSSWILRAGNAGGSGSSSEEGADLFDVQMLSNEMAYVCGKDGYFAKTVNGGVNWVSQNSTVTEDLEALHFPSSGTGYVCYELGKVKQTNGTGLFVSAYAATSKDLKDLWFINNQRGWVIGDEGRILLTNDGGHNWTTHNVNTSEELTAIHFPSAYTGYIVGKDGMVFKIQNAHIAGNKELEDISTAIVVSPNPVSNELKIDLTEAIYSNENFHIQLIDQQGKIVWETEQVSTPTFLINTSLIEKGIYMLQLTSGKSMAISKIIKI